MFQIGNLRTNASRDSSEIPPWMIKDLEAQLLHLRDPLLEYEEDIEYHDAIRSMALEEIDTNQSKDERSPKSPSAKGVSVEVSSVEEEPSIYGEPAGPSTAPKKSRTIKNFIRKFT